MIPIQYQNSPIICYLVEYKYQYFDSEKTFNAFYDMAVNIDTAQGFGLDIWGRIVGVGRYLQIKAQVEYFGFDDGVNDYTPFDGGSFYDYEPTTQTYRLDDDAYRVLILVKAMANIIDTTSPLLNRLLQSLFKDRGRCYVLDLGGMAMRFVFEFYLEPFEKAFINTPGLLPHSAGVRVETLEVPVPNVFGFDEAGISSAPFDQGVFFID